jgi:hypothetical protein
VESIKLGGTSSWVAEVSVSSARNATFCIKEAEVAPRPSRGPDSGDDVEVLKRVEVSFSLPMFIQLGSEHKEKQFGHRNAIRDCTSLPKCLLVNHLPLQVSQVALELALCPLLFAFEPRLPFGVLLQSLRGKHITN